ncbi:hypothetical protein FPQ14_04180 [Gilliamella apicola]|uniref:Uncharacterized protein n=1 Tax=Gilliamella apicola TaxID=1196095 RepID=A0A556RN36_9GAMM|nr:hypothetical protein [Gilliamella apicola]TSJ90271.1 hypothetical protein FPQ14_04180 [Gilliamella apicola]
MIIKKLTVIACSSLISCMAFAQNDSVSITDKIVDSFLTCDNQFFKQLDENKQLFSEYVDLITTDNVTYIPVESIYQQNKDKVNFKKPLKYHGLTITGYQNIYIPTNLSGQYYYWGFIFDNNQEEITNTLNNLKWLKYNNGVYIANAKIYDRNAKPPVWQDNPYSIDGVVPKLGTIEKSLYLENVSNNQNRVLCSIQGDLKKDILYKDRPDIKPLDEQMDKERQEKIKAYKLKKQKEKEQKEAQDKPIENSKKEGDKI